jgi:hypothetical protein
MKGELLQEAASERAGDHILVQLEGLLAGKVTEPLDETEWAECVAEANRRIEAEEPPGFKDADKVDGDSPEGAAGDYLVWYQATRHAREKNLDLLIVTRDEKEDWWWRQQAAFLGPRPELTLEFRRLAGRRLFLMRPVELLARASVLQVNVDQASTADAGRVAQTEEATATTLWTVEALTALLGRLETAAPVQAKALRLATSEAGGRVPREEIYRLGEFDDDRVLRGFTRPFTRLTEALQSEGLVPPGVAPIFVARYPDGVRASYFSVPPEVPQLLDSL